MKIIKIVSLAIVAALIVYTIYSWLSNRETFVSPLPEGGIKIIQISPTK